jgi:hypothetical protein
VSSSTSSRIFDFLPGFWKNFGGSFNVLLHHDRRQGSGGKVRSPCPACRRNNLNLIGYYETSPKFGVAPGLQLARQVRPGRRQQRSSATRARSRRAASWTPRPRTSSLTDVSVSVDAFNLTDATRSEYENDPMLPRRIDYDGRTYQVTLRTTF